MDVYQLAVLESTEIKDSRMNVYQLAVLESKEIKDSKRRFTSSILKFKDSRMRVYSLDIEEKLGVEETKDVEGLIKRLFKKSVGSRG